MITITLKKEEKNFFNTFIQEHPESVIVLERKMLSGDSDLIQIMIIISPTLITVLGNIIVELIKVKKSFSIKHKGVEINGITEKNAIEILQHIIELEENSQDNG